MSINKNDVSMSFQVLLYSCICICTLCFKRSTAQSIKVNGHEFTFPNKLSAYKESMKLCEDNGTKLAIIRENGLAQKLVHWLVDLDAGK